MTSAVSGASDPKFAAVKEEFERNFAERGRSAHQSACR